MKVTVIISYYKNQPNLTLILNALNRQTVSDFEVIVSEDDKNPDTLPFLNSFREKVSYSILHTFQNEDLGFRKNSMLNKSIKEASGETIAFIDGDCVPHSAFVEECIKNTEDGCMLIGRRVMLSQKLSQKALDAENPAHFSLINVLFSSSGMKKEAIYAPNLTLSHKKRGLVGCNWAIKKKHLLEINGFDEDYVSPGAGEDTDIEWRLKRIGIQNKYVKNKMIVYHLYHKRSYAEEGVQKNQKMMREKIALDNFKCLNGLDKL